MRGFVLAAFAALLISSPAAAATYHVKADGNNSSAGTSYATAWATIAKADAAARPGDIVYVYNRSGTWDRFPNPDSAASRADGTYITYIGATRSPLGDALTDSVVRSSIRLPGGSWTNKKYVVVKGFSIVGGLSTDTLSVRDSLISIDFSGATYIRGSYLTFLRCNFNATTSFIGGPTRLSSGMSLAIYRPSKAQKYIDCKWTNLIPGSNHAFIFEETDSLLFQRCRLRWTVPPDVAGDAHPWDMYTTRRGRFEDCFFEYDSRSSRPDRGWGGVILRDFTAYMTFKRDTFVTIPGATGRLDLALSTSGTYGGTVRAITMDSCFVWLQNGSIVFQDRTDSLTMTNNVLVGMGASVFNSVGPKYGPNNISYNTFVSGSYYPGAYGVVEFEAQSFLRDSTKFYNNIVYSAAPRFTIPWSTKGAALQIKPPGYENLYKANWNLYRFLPYTNDYYIGQSHRERSLGWYPIGGSFLSDTAGANNNFKFTFPANRRGDADSLSLSVLGEVFSDATLVGNFWQFDPTPAVGSPAIGMGVNGTTVGARASTAAPLIVLSKQSHSLSTPAVGVEDTLSFDINNPGTANLEITLTMPTAEFSTDSLTFEVAPSSQRRTTVLITPTSVAPRVETIQIAHNVTNHQNPIPFYVGFTFAPGGGDDDTDGFVLPD